MSETENLIRQHEWRANPYGILRWAIGTQLKNEKGILLEWVDRRFLIEPLCDLHPRQVIVKCSQVGLSTAEILKSAFMAQIHGYGVIYTLPTDKLLEDFAATKVNLIYDNNPAIRPPEADSVGKRVYGPGFVLYRGTFGERQQISITADIIVADEADRSNLQVLYGLRSRLDASPYQGEWWFTNPSRPNVGTDVLWRQSDQRKWHIVCPDCHTQQVLDYWENIDRNKRIYICWKCKSKLPNETRRSGQWIPTQAGSDWHGYHINQLMAPWIPAGKLIDAEMVEPKEQFYNFRLGLPLVGQGVSVDPVLILGAQMWPIPQEIQPKQKFMGVDVGSGLHVVIGNEHGITKLAYLVDQSKKDDRWDQLDQIMSREQINLCVIDNAPPEKQTDFQKQFPYKVLRCIYDYDDKRAAPFESDRSAGLIWAHRTRIIDDVLDAYTKGELAVFIEGKDSFFGGAGRTGMVENCLAGHWSTLFVVGADGQDINLVKKDRMGNVIRTWENSGPDHFAHANVYYWLARQAGRWLGEGKSFIPGASKERRRPDDDDDDDDEDKRRPGFFG